MKIGADTNYFSLKKDEVINMKNTKKNNKKVRAGSKDMWNAFMVEGAEFTGNDIPVCPTVLTGKPKRIVTWLEAKEIHKEMMRKDKEYYCDAFTCFYIDDQYFDGQRTSIWTFPWLAMRVISHFRGIISPDFSTFMDFPEPISEFNTYRMRAFGHWIGKEGKEVINNIRWGLPHTYRYCFDGIPKNSVVAIGTVGGSPRKLEDRERFEEGLFEMVKRLNPHTIIVYGSANYPCFDLLREKGIEIIAHQGQTNAAYERSVKK